MTSPTKASTAPRLSDEQQRIIAYRGGHLQVVACAGSGKTETVAQRIASLLADGVAPVGIVAFTFTRAVARGEWFTVRAELGGLRERRFEARPREHCGRSEVRAICRLAAREVR